MRKTLSVVAALITFFIASAQPTTGSETQDPLKLKETEHDFGKIPQGRPVYYTFQIVNTSAQALKLDDVHASCGATAQIRVGYNAAAENYFEKFITITYNTNQTKQLKIFGTVWKAPEGAAPANASVQFLKKQTL
jgi:UDP-glucose 4-epimerase